jgi:hypothetical protein
VSIVLSSLSPHFYSLFGLLSGKVRSVIFMLNSVRSLLAQKFCTLALVFVAISSLNAGEVVYDNLDHYLNRYANEKREYGDELELTGTARTVTDFLFEYYGDFVPGADERAKIRFYQNDYVLSEFQVAPGTLLFESGWFPITPGRNARQISGLNVDVPDNFTFTIEFAGLTMTKGDEAGLLFFHPISKGNGFDDYWARDTRGNFALYKYPDVKNNFGAQVIAVPEPGTTFLAVLGLVGLGGFAAVRRRIS